MILSNQAQKTIEELDQSKRWSEVDWDNGEGAQLIVELCESLLKQGYGDFRSNLKESFCTQYPSLFKKLIKVTGECSCERFNWSEHVCPHDIKDQVSSPSSCTCCPSCRLHCYDEAFKEGGGQ